MSARSRTIYLRPPEPKRPRRDGSVADRLSAWLFRYRHQLWPLAWNLLYLLGTTAGVAQTGDVAPWYFVVLASVSAGAAYQWGHLLRVGRYRPLRLERDRYYFVAVV